MVVSTRLRCSPLVRGLGRLLLAAAGSAGCASLPGTAPADADAAPSIWSWDRWNPFASEPPPGPADSLVLRGDKLEPEVSPAQTKAAADLAGAHELYRQGEYKQAEKIFHRLAGNTKNPALLAEEARFYEAECLRRQERYPKAKDTYNKMLQDFPAGQYREPAIQRMFEIANYWLDDTRLEMDLVRQKEKGERWFVWTEPLHFEKAKPLVDEEGRALEALEQVRYNDMTGPLADKALFLSGSVKYFREDYKEADYHFSQLVELHPNSPFAPQALELAIISKHMSTGGSDYDGRKVAEARQLVDTALRNYPELVRDKKDFLERQLIGITLQQADKDYKIAEFYRRIGKPQSAYFCYEIVRRRYPGTKYFDLATERMHDIRAKAEADGLGAPPVEPPEPGQAPETMPQPRRLLPAAPGDQLEVTPPPRQLPPEMLK
jgi:outer membrane protein assembly factor BamD (BamD/ComL family)